MKDIIAMYAPTAKGGHPMYVDEVLTALASSQSDDFDYQLLTSTDLDVGEGKTGYDVFRILPRLKDKKEFRHKLSWVLSRLFHYPLIDLVVISHLLRSSRIKVLHLQETNSVSTLFLILIARYLLRRDIVLTVHNITPHSYPNIRLKALIDSISRAIYKNAHSNIVHSAKLKADLLEFEPRLNSNSIFVAPHGVWSTSAAKTELANKLHSKNILFFGTFRRNKGLMELLLAFESLSTDYSLMIAGFPSDRSFYAEELIPVINRMQGNGCSLKVLAEFIPDKRVAELFNEADVLVLPYKEFSSQSGVLFNAIGYTVPVICAAAGALGETVIENKIGVVIDRIDTASLGSAITGFFAGPVGQYHENLMLARDKLSWSTHAKVLMSAYDRDA